MPVIMPDIIFCWKLLTDDAASNTGFFARFVPSLCRILCRILSTDDAGYAAGSDTELTLVLMPVPFRPQCWNIFIFCWIIYIDDAGSNSGYGAGYK